MTKEELEANEFAACLLMPRNEVVKKYKENLSIKDVCTYFGVTVQVAKYRLKKLGLI